MVPGGAVSSVLLRYPAQKSLSLEILVGGDCDVGRMGIREGGAIKNWMVLALFAALKHSSRPETTAMSSTED